jgi:OsmC-like protein
LQTSKRKTEIMERIENYYPIPGEVVVRGDAAGFAQQIAVGSHRLIADEPISVGGTDTGPNPHDLLLASLGACTSMTVAMYARRKHWPLESVTVRLRHSKFMLLTARNARRETAWWIASNGTSSSRER